MGSEPAKVREKSLVALEALRSEEAEEEAVIYMTMVTHSHEKTAGEQRDKDFDQKR